MAILQGHAFVNEGDKRGGRKAFADFIAHMDDCYDERLTDIVVMASADGSRAAAEFMLEGEYLVTDGDLPAAAGQRYRLRVGAFFEIRDGRIARVSNHYNLADWLAQVGG